MINVGVIGFGYWGPNVVRNLSAQSSLRLVAICDRSPEALRRAKCTYPAVEVTTDPSSITQSNDIDAVAIVTPVWTHYELAKAALQNGKHVFVEKPFTSNSAEAEELIELAERKKLVIMVDHTFLFTGAVRKIRELIDDGELGNLDVAQDGLDSRLHSAYADGRISRHKSGSVWQGACHLSIMS